MQFCPEAYRAQLATEQPNTAVRTNRERAAAGKPSLHEVVASPKHPLDLRLFVGQHVEVVLGRDVLASAPASAQKRRIWGDGDFTGDTDMVLALLHDGYLARACADTGFNWPKRVEQVRALVSVNASAKDFPGTERNGICSRSWHLECCGCSYSIERAWLQWREVRFATCTVVKTISKQCCKARSERAPATDARPLCRFTSQYRSTISRACVRLLQGRDKEREGSADAPPRKSVAIELTRMPNAMRVLPSVSIATVGDQRAMGSRAAASASERRRRISSIDEVGRRVQPRERAVAHVRVAIHDRPQLCAQPLLRRSSSRTARSSSRPSGAHTQSPRHTHSPRSQARSMRCSATAAALQSDHITPNSIACRVPGRQRNARVRSVSL